MTIKPRVLVLPIAAVTIAALCAYKLSLSEEPADPHQRIRRVGQAPLFELYDQRKPPQLAQLRSFLGRHEIVLVFFSAQTGLNDPNLNWLRNHAEPLRKKGVKVFGISTELPQTHRKMLDDQLTSGEQIPFVLLSDLDSKVHQMYGRIDDEGQKLLPGVFLIDRAGNLHFDREQPLALEDSILELQEHFDLE